MWNFIAILETLIVFCFIKGSLGIVISNVPVCSTFNLTPNLENCTKIISAMINLRNEEKYHTILKVKNPKCTKPSCQNKTFNAISLILKKSTVSYIYDLEYTKDFFSALKEDIYRYTYAETGSDAKQYCLVTMDKQCQSDSEAYKTSFRPNKTPIAFSNGKCCICQKTSLSSSSQHMGPIRAELSCSITEHLSGNNIYAVKVCPRALGPWYSGFSIDQYKWDFNITLTLKRCLIAEKPQASSGHTSPHQSSFNSQQSTNTETPSSYFEMPHSITCSEEKVIHVLNTSVPAVHNEEFGVSLRIISSNPQVGKDPPSLSDKMLFIPREILNTSTALDAKLQNLLKESMLIPSKHVDLLGNQCDKIGTTTRKWGSGSDFCNNRPLTCMSNQLSEFLKSDKRRIKNKEKPQYLIFTGGSKDMANSFDMIKDGVASLFSSTETSSETKQSYFLQWKYEPDHVTGLEMEMDAESLAYLKPPTQGRIVEIKVQNECEPFQSMGCEIVVTAQNTGNFAQRLTLSIPYCISVENYNQQSNLIKAIAPVPPISKEIMENSVENFTFMLRSENPGSQNFTCQVDLGDSDSKIMDSRNFNVTFKYLIHKYHSYRESKLWKEYGQKPGSKQSMSNLFLDVVGGITGIRPSSSSSGESEKETTGAKEDCACSLFQVVCILFQFKSCFRKYWGNLIIGLGSIISVILLLIFGPSIVRFIRSAFNACSTRLEASRARKRQRQYEIDLESPYPGSSEEPGSNLEAKKECEFFTAKPAKELY